MNKAYALTSDIAQYLENLGNPWKNIQSLQGIITGLINLILVVATVVFVFLLLSGGIQWITAGGDKEKIGSAQKRLTSALIGLIVVFSVWAIMRLISTFFGLNLLGGS